MEFGSRDEHEALIENLHFFLVYAGKNNVLARNPVTMPGKMKIQHDNRGKQNQAGRMKFDSEKTENDVYDKFGEQLQRLGLAVCKESVFPGKALPRAKKRRKGSARERYFTMFSACDFAEVVNAGFFFAWKWGAYAPYFKAS